MTLPDLEHPDPSEETVRAWSTHLGRTVRDPEHLRASLAAGPTLSRAFDEVARIHGEASALTIGGIALTHGDVSRRSKQLAASLHQRGAGVGTRVTIAADADSDVVLVYLACLRVGAVATFAFPTYTSVELRRILTVSRSEFVLATGASLGVVAETDPGLSVIGLKPSDRRIVSDILEPNGSGDGPPEPIDADSVAILAFTSGSTGEPKPVPLTHRALLSSIRAAATAWRWSADDLLVHSLPIGHQHGLGGVHIALLTGSHTVILPRFEPGLLLDTIDTHHASALFAVPTIYRRLVEETPTAMAVLGRLRLMVSGSAPLPVSLAERVELLTGQLPLERYGCTETGLNVSNPYEGPRIPGSVGLPLPGVEVAIVAQDGELAGRGEPGEVLVRGPQVFPGYEGEETSSFTHGWFRTGDLGVIDERSGYLNLVGRAKDLIISGGMNVYPREVETALCAVPGVLDAAVIGAPSERWGETVIAFVVSDGVTPGEISAAVVETLAPYKRPKQIVETPAIPRDAMGKVRREKLPPISGVS